MGWLSSLFGHDEECVDTASVEFVRDVQRQIDEYKVKHPHCEHRDVSRFIDKVYAEAESKCRK
jgi:hypothetical protein